MTTDKRRDGFHQLPDVTGFAPAHPLKRTFDNPNSTARRNWRSRWVSNPHFPKINPGVLSQLNYGLIRRLVEAPDAVLPEGAILRRRKFRWASDVIERRHSMPGIEPGPPRLSPRTVHPPYWWKIIDQLRPIENLLELKN
jgi:hypothetical protein